MNIIPEVIIPLLGDIAARVAEIGPVLRVRGIVPRRLLECRGGFRVMTRVGHQQGEPVVRGRHRGLERKGGFEFGYGSIRVSLSATK